MNSLTQAYPDESAVWLGGVIAGTSDESNALQQLGGTPDYDDTNRHSTADLTATQGNFDSSTTQNSLGLLGFSGQQDTSAYLDTVDEMSFRVETKIVYVCTHENCNKKYSRMPDLRRHYRGAHQDDRRFKCRALGCERAVRGFPRRNKRDIHEQRMHMDIGNGILL
jgi:uncharacterized Zn-finger protein